MDFPTYQVSLANVPEKLKPYFFHGVELDYRNREWSVGTCPFCQKDSHFYVKVEDGRFKCQRCNIDGNVYSFLAQLYSLSSAATPPSLLENLAEDRGVSPESLAAFEIVKSVSTGEFIIPGYNSKRVITNIFRISPYEADGKLKWRIMSTPGCKVTPYGMQEFWSQPPKNRILVTEGLWDGCALWDALRSHRQDGKTGKLIKTSDAKASMYSSIGILCIPSAGNFQSEWFEYLQGTRTDLLMDNDHPKLFPADHEKAGQVMMQRGKPVRPGWDGMERIVKLANNSSKQPKQLFMIFWNPEGGHNPELPDGYDIRDHLALGSNLSETYPTARMVPHSLSGLFAMLQPAKLSSPTKEEPAVPTVKPIERTSFDELISDYEATFHITQNIRDTLAVMMAVILSTEAEPINHLWLRVIGPPGSLKSTLAEAVSAAREYVNPKSVLTGFHSGFVDPTSDKTASLIPQFDRKTAVIKDADTLNNSPHRDQIMRELRDLYDGTSRSAYRNKAGDEFEDIRVSFILCGTDELRNLNRTFLGERFIDCEIIDRGEDTKPYLQRVVSSTYQNLLSQWDQGNAADDNEEPHSPSFIKAVTYGFIKYLKENYKNFAPPLMDETTQKLFEAMGVFVAKVRARNRKDADINYKPRTELGTRPGAQFTKLAFFTGLVLQKPTVDHEVIRIVKKVVRDTCVSFQADIVQTLANAANPDHPDYRDGGIDIRWLLSTIPAPETTVRRILQDMREFGVLQTRTAPNNSGQRGRDRHVWELTPHMLELYNIVFAEPPKSKKAAPKPKRRPVRGSV